MAHSTRMSFVCLNNGVTGEGRVPLGSGVGRVVVPLPGELDRGRSVGGCGRLLLDYWGEYEVVQRKLTVYIDERKVHCKV